MNLGDFIDKYKEAIARRVVESYPPLYQPSENGGKLPRLLRTPLASAGWPFLRLGKRRFSEARVWTPWHAL